MLSSYFFSACLLYASSELNHAFLRHYLLHFSVLPSPALRNPALSNPTNIQVAAVPSVAAPLALRMMDNFHQTFYWFCSHAFCLVSLSCLICLCHCILSYFCFSTTLHYLHKSTELVFYVHHYTMAPAPNCGFRQWIARIILSYIVL